MLKSEINASEYHPYYATYLDLVDDRTELIDGFLKDKETIENLIQSISEEKLSYRYQPEKWSIKELIQHLIDTERIFMYRCLRIARNDKTPLTGFEQNDYIKPSEADKKTKEALLEEFSTSRQNSIVLLKSLSDNNLCFQGNANGANTSARAIAFMVLGHNSWHTKIILERYL